LSTRTNDLEGFVKDTQNVVVVFSVGEPNLMLYSSALDHLDDSRQGPQSRSSCKNEMFIWYIDVFNLLEGRGYQARSEVTVIVVEMTFVQIAERLPRFRRWLTRSRYSLRSRRLQCRTNIT